MLLNFQMIPVSKDALPDNKPKSLTREEIEKRRAVARQRHQEQQLAKAEQMQETLAGVTMEFEQKLSVEETQPLDTNEENEEDDVFIGFARVYSGTLRKGAKIYALMPKHDPRTLE